MECQKRGASSLDANEDENDDDDDDDGGSKEDDEDLAALWSVLDALLGSSNSAGLRGADSSVVAGAEENSVRKRTALL